MGFSVFNEIKDLATVSYDQCTSTNEIAKNLKAPLAHSLEIIIADEQTHGRGRGSHHWLSCGSGNALLVSFATDLKTSPQPIASPLMGLWLFLAAKKIWPKALWSLKAPNDLYLSGVKVGGLLCETITEGEHFRFIIGLGLNVLATPQNLDFNATSLAKVFPVTAHDFQLFFKELINTLSHYLDKVTKNSLIEADRKLLVYALNQNSFLKIPFTDITPNGDLINSQGKTSWQNL